MGRSNIVMTTDTFFSLQKPETGPGEFFVVTGVGNCQPECLPPPSTELSLISPSLIFFGIFCDSLDHSGGLPGVPGAIWGFPGALRGGEGGPRLKMTKCEKIFSLVATCSEGLLGSI